MRQLGGELVSFSEQGDEIAVVAEPDDSLAVPVSLADGGAAEQQQYQAEDFSAAQAGGGGGFRGAAQHEVVHQLARAPEDYQHRPVLCD